MRMIRDIARLKNLDATKRSSKRGGKDKKSALVCIGIVLVISLYYEYVRLSQIGSILLWNGSGETITINKQKLPTSPLSVIGAKRHEVYSKRRSINYYTHIEPTQKKYNYLYFDVHHFRKKEEIHPGFRIKFQAGLKTIALGCPDLVHDKPYNLMSIGYDDKLKRYFAVCSHIQMQPFLKRFPIGSFHSVRHVLVTRKYFEDATKRIRVYRVTPAHAKLNTLRF